MGDEDVAPFCDSDAVCNFRPHDFKDSSEIGKGKDCTVYSACCQKLEGRRVAVKVYEKAKLSASKLRAVTREASMMIYMTRKRVPLITQFYGAFQDAYQIFLVMEYCSGGDLLERLKQENRAMSERRVILEVAVPLLRTLQHMHGHSIIHRDVKLENIFISGDGRVRLGDFGLTMSMKQELAISPVGTVEYMAPEVVALPPVEAVISGAVKTSDITPCTEKVDIWALGVTLYELLTGHLPFEGDVPPCCKGREALCAGCTGVHKAQIKAAIAAGRLRPFGPQRLSPACTAFVSAMLLRDPKQRPSARQLLQHPAVLAFSRSAAAPMITVSPGQPGGAAQQAALQALHFAAVSDSVASMEAGVPPLYRPGGAVATATVKPTVAGVAVNAAAGAPRDGWPAALRQPQPASTSPELAQPPYALISEGSLIKARHAAVEFLQGGASKPQHHSHHHPQHGQQPNEEPSSHSSASSGDAFHANSSGGSGCETPTTTGGSAGGSAEGEGTPLRARYAPPRPSSSAAVPPAPLLREGTPPPPAAAPHGRPRSAPVQARAWQQLPPIPTWAEMDAQRQGAAPMAVSQGQSVRAPSPVRMTKAAAAAGAQPGRLRRQAASFGSSSSSHSSSGGGQAPSALLAAAGPLSAAADDAAASQGLMTRVTSLLNRALCKPSSRGPEPGFAGNKRTAAAYLSS